MPTKEINLALRAKKLWEERDLHALVALRRTPGAAAMPDVLYFIGLAYNALNKRRQAIESWRKASAIDPGCEAAVRALAYELADQAPGDSAELFYQLIGLRRANADDFTCLGEIRIKQDRLGEARRWLEYALKLEPKNSLALLAMANVYAQVHDPALTLEYLKKAAATDDLDLADLASDPQFDFLWHHPTFKRIVSANGRKGAQRPMTN
jgi:tetratricopeptide (TPR) repeat protein